MYSDTLLFMLAGLCLAIAVYALVYLLISRKRGLLYRAALQQETEFFDALAATARQSGAARGSSPLREADHQLSSGGGAAEDSAPLPDYGATRLTDDLAGGGAAEACSSPQPPSAAGSAAAGVCFDAAALEGRYVLEEEISGGGMSRVFVARSSKLGNRWIIKYIADKRAALAKEEHILKQLNHISLPKIADVFRDGDGVYLVESYIEGLTLAALLAARTPLNQTLIQDWAEQLAQVLSYLHNMEPAPICHFDLKPSNVMVTHDNRLVLIDFGIAGQLRQEGGGLGVTYKYAAPEQLKHPIAAKHLELLESRFGRLPEERFNWQPGVRTDIYSLGVLLFELATGQIATRRNSHLLPGLVGRELGGIIKKCLETDPQDRYQSARELLDALQKIKGSKVKMVKALLLRKLAALTMACSLFLSLGSFGGGYYLYGQENLAQLTAEPALLTLSLQQSAELRVEKHLPDGRAVFLDPHSIRWDFSPDNIARIDGNRAVGLNAGQTAISGHYRNKRVSLQVKVVPPLPQGLIDIVQIYQPGRTLALFAGGAQRGHSNGPLATAGFVSPESIEAAEDGSLYITDSGLLRKISNGALETVALQPAYISARQVRCRGAEIYLLTHGWEDADGVYYGLLRLGREGAEILYKADAAYTAIEDFVSAGGLLYFIERNEGVGKTYLKTLALPEATDIQIICELPRGSSALAADEAGRLYIADPTSGVIQVFYEGALSYFAGTGHNKAFIDGAAPLFYMPQRLRYAAGYLYVWDFNVLRRLEAQEGLAGTCITLAGEASPDFAPEPGAGKQAAESAILPHSKLTDFALQDGNILLTDPKRGVIWRLE